ncbi:MAG: response regulator transcription factor [Bacteroidota bacterium]
MIRIVLVDDHELFRLGLRGIINKYQDVEILKEYGSAEDFMLEFEHINFDMALIDISLGGDNGLQLIQKLRLKKNDAKLVVLTMHKEEFYLIKALEAGVDGYLHKDIDAEELYNAIRKVKEGKKYFSSDITEILVNNVYAKSAGGRSIPKLSTREMEIIKLIVDGYSSKEIADKLVLSPRTIDSHRANILEKFGFKNTAELIKIAIKEKLI